MLKTDSRKIVGGDTFLALKGINTDGHDYIDMAIKNGATKIICEHGDYSVETLVVANTRNYLADYLKNLYGDKLRDIKFIGITGTNGKTTSANLVFQMLNKLGTSTAYIGTIGFYIEDRIIKTNNTTPDLMELYEMFNECIINNIKVIVLEVSSHSLEIGRLLGIDFNIVAFTNLTQDHLDVHGSFENYMKAKQKLFNKTKDEKIAILNCDDPYFNNFILDNNNNITYGVNSNDYKIVSYDLKMNGTKFVMEHNSISYEINMGMPGKYNIYNYILSLIICHKMGYSIDNIINLDIHTPKGRFEIINYKTNVIIIDYAHTPDAMENILKSCNELKENKIITIVGCGGNRDKTKRPIMGDVATKYSDYVIFTDDNPRYENNIDITNDIVRNLNNTNYEIINDRYEATKKGFSMLDHYDMLLLLGKGHEDYQVIGNEKVHYSDLETVVELIKEK